MRTQIMLGLIFCSQLGAAWQYSRPIAFDHNKVKGSLTAYPVPIFGSYSYLATVANGGKVENANGYDIGFASDAACTSMLNWEITRYTGSSGSVIYWLPVNLNTSSDTIVYLCYGNTSISSDQSHKNAVYDSHYKLAAHMEEAPGSDAKDSTSNGGDLTANHLESDDLVTGKVGNAITFDGGASLEYYSRADNAALSLTGPLTLEAWVYLNSLAGSTGQNKGVLAKYVSEAPFTNQRAYELVVKPDTTKFNLTVSTAGTSVSKSTDSTTSVSTGTWMRLAAVFTPSTSIKLFLNCTLDATDASSIPSAIYDSTAPFTVGTQFAVGTASNYLDGLIDEPTVSDVGRSDAWVNQACSAQSTGFYTIGAETPLTGTVSVSRRTPVMIQ